MIDTKEKLRACLKKERAFYITEKSKKDRIVEWAVNDPLRRIWKYQKALRYTEYYCHQKGWKKLFLYTLARRRKNRLGLQLGFELAEDSFEEGLILYHTGNIVVNGYSRIGKDCHLHGSNCIGNNGITLDCPVIGDRVDIGVGAKIIGGVRIADDVKIGAGAVVNKSFEEPGITIAGIPAKKVKSAGQ